MVSIGWGGCAVFNFVVSAWSVVLAATVGVGSTTFFVVNCGCSVVVGGLTVVVGFCVAIVRVNVGKLVTYLFFQLFQKVSILYTCNI